LFSNLYGFWVTNYVAFNGDVIRELATQFLALAEKYEATVPRMIGHRMMGCSLASTGDLAQGRMHFDRAITLYDPAAHRSLAARFGQDNRVTVLSYRSVVVWLLGYPEAAFADAEHAVKHARELGQQPRSSASGSRSPRTPDLTIFAPNRASSSFAPNRIPHSAKTKWRRRPPDAAPPSRPERVGVPLARTRGK
jgi:hypothetical protein